MPEQSNMHHPHAQHNSSAMGSAIPGATPPSEPWSINTDEQPTVLGSEMSPSGYNGSMQQILQQNVGYFVECEFLVGTQTIVSRRGILYSVGVSFLVLYEAARKRYTVCDFYALKFITFFEPGHEPVDAR